MNPKDLVGAKKAPLRYVPPALVIGVSEAMDIGQRKYGPFNWRLQPVSAMTYIEAIQRHLAAWVDGQDNAEDTGVHHLKHAGASIAILLDALGSGDGLLDDRPPKGPAAALLNELDKSAPPKATHDGPCNHGVPCESNGDGDPETSEWPASMPGTSIMALIEHHEKNIRPVRDAWYREIERRINSTLDANSIRPVRVTAESWGEGWLNTEADLSGTAKVENRGVWPPDTRVNGLLTCCGQSDHPLECPQWR